MTVKALVRTAGAERWADRICTQLGKSVEAIIEVGRLLVKAKAELPHGEWLRLFSTDLLPFGHQTATRLMAIAQHRILSNVSHGTSLPPSWRTLYDLSRVEPKRLTAALNDGTITPDMPRKAVATLLPPKTHTSRRRSTLKPEADATEYRTAGSRLYFQIARLLSDEFETLSIADQEDLLSMLDQTLAELRANRLERAVEA